MKISSKKIIKPPIGNCRVFKLNCWNHKINPSHKKQFCTTYNFNVQPDIYIDFYVISYHLSAYIHFSNSMEWKFVYLKSIFFFKYIFLFRAFVTYGLYTSYNHALWRIWYTRKISIHRLSPSAYKLVAWSVNIYYKVFGF